MGYRPTYDLTSIKVFLGTVGAGSMTNGSAHLTVSSFPPLPGHGSGNPFTLADVGNWVQVIGGNGPGTNLVAQVAGFIDANNVTLTATAGATVGGSGFYNVIIFRRILVRVGSLRIEETATARDTATFTTQFAVPVERQPVLITSSDPAVGTGTAGAIFGGRIDSVEIDNEPATGIRTCTCQCVSWECLADTRTMLAKDYSATDSSIIAAGVLANLREDFVGLSIVGTPASVQSFSADGYSFLNAVLDNLVTQIGTPGVGYFWRAKPFREFEFGEIATTAAPWGIDDSSGSDSNILINIKHTRNLDKYANHAYAKADQVLGSPITLSGRALVLSRVITYPDIIFGAIPKLVVNGVTQVVKEPDTNTIDPRSVGEWSSTFNYGIGVLVYMNPPPTGVAPQVYKSIQTPNVNQNPTTSPTFWTPVSIVNPTGADWVWIKGTGYLWTDPSHPGIPAGQNYTLTYVTGADGPPSFNEYAAGVAETSSVQGGLGFIETVVNVNLPITRDDLNTRAVAESELYGIIPETIEFKTYRGGLQKYQTIPIKLTDMGINDTYVITDVTLDMSEEFYPVWEVKCLLGSLVGDWATAFIAAFGGPVPAGGSPISSGNVPVPPTLGMYLTNSTAATGQPFAGSLVGTGGTSPYVYAIVSGALPTGLSLDPGSGAITGSPSAVGTFAFTASVTDVMGGVFTASFSIATSIAPGTAPIVLNLAASAAWNFFNVTVSGSFDLDLSNVDFPHESQVIVRVTDAATNIRVAPDVVIIGPFGVTVHRTFQAPDFSRDPNSAKTYAVTAISINEIGEKNATAPSVNVSVTLPTEVSVSANETTPIASTRHADSNRSVYIELDYTPVVTNPIYPMPITVWANKVGATKKWRGAFTVTGAGVLHVGAVGTKEEFDIFAPTTGNETWEVTFAVGKFDSNAPPPAQAKTSSGFSVLNAQVPLFGSIIAGNITIAGGAGGSFPYNLVDPDGTQKWSIPSITVNTAAAFADPNVFTLNITAQDLDASGNPIGIEHIFETPEVINGSIVMGPLEGPYGSVADPQRSGSIGKVRLRFYSCNRVNQTTTAWQDATAATFQVAVDVVVAAGGATPSGSIQGPRVTGAVPTALIANSASTVPGSGITGPTVNIGGSGALVAVWQVKDNSGNVVAAVGNVSGLGFGLYAQQAWFGTGGPGPNGAKIWLDSFGNGHFTGSIETGSNITAPSISGGTIVGTSIQITNVSGYTVQILSGAAGTILNITGGGSSLVASSAILTVQSGSLGVQLNNFGQLLVFGPGSSSQVNTNNVVTSAYFINGTQVINGSAQFVGAGVSCPSSGVSCFSLTVSSGGITVPGGFGTAGSQAIAVKDSLGSFCHLVVNGVDLGAVRLNMIYGIYCGTV